MMILLVQCDFNICKTLQVFEMNQVEMKNYMDLYENIGVIFYEFYFTWPLWWTYVNWDWKAPLYNKIRFLLNCYKIDLILSLDV